jgi:hypothetical protein
MNIEYQGIPPRSLNGGLYTGTPFNADALWGNVPVIPDTYYMIHHQLKTCNPPPGATSHYPHTARPGNNPLTMPDKQTLPMYNIVCTSCKKDYPMPCKCKKCSFSKYAYLE